LNFEHTAKGELIITLLIGGETANREAELITDFGIWNRQSNLGYPSVPPLYLSYPMALIVRE
jgi:Uma2 family endonuclease